MPKMKTHSGAKKRFKVSGTGKIRTRQGGKAHLNEHKPTSRTRRLTGMITLSKPQAKVARKQLGR